MKKNYTPVIRLLTASVMLLLVSAFTLLGQTPTTFNYQAVLRDADGNINSNANVSIQIQLHQGTSTGTIVYSETHTTTTSEFGMVNLEIGSGTPATFDAIDWSAGPYFVEVSVNGTSMGTSELLTVPYALYAVNGVPGPQGDPGPQGEQGIQGEPGPPGIIEDNSVGSAHVINNSLTADDLAPNSVGSSEIADDAVGTSEIADGSVTSAKLVDGPGSGVDADLLDSQDGSFYRNANNLNAGTLNNGRFSAYSDLSAEGYLDNNSTNDLLTRTQADARYLTPHVAFLAYSSSIATITTTGWRTVDFDSESFDHGSDYDVVNDRFVAPVRGVYNFTGKVGLYGWDAVGTAILGYAVNGSGSAFNKLSLEYSSTTTNHEITLTGSVTLALDAGDIVTIGFWNSGDSNFSLASGLYNRTFCGHIVYQY